jgi:PHP family Zn ribbon phosphoesterase
MITCECGEKMTKYEQPNRFGQKFIFWKCERCGKMVKEEVEGSKKKVADGTDN